MTWLTTSDSWTSEDKFSHGFGSTALYLALSARGIDPWYAAAGVALVGIGIEVIELIRYRRWMARGGAGRWPPLTDLMSPKDLAWDAMGILAGVLLR